MKNIIHVSTLDEFLAAARSAAAGAVIRLENGTHYLDHSLLFAGLRDLTLDFGGSTVKTQYDPTQYAYDPKRDTPASTDAFIFEECENLLVCNVTVTASVPTNVGGRITAVTATGKDMSGYVELALNDIHPRTGEELFLGGVNFGENWEQERHFIGTHLGTQDNHALIAGEISTSQPQRLNCENKVQVKEGENVWRVPHQWKNVEVGQRCNEFHIYYGVANFTYRNCVGMTMEDIRFTNAAGMGFVILPRCRDFTFRRIRVCADCPEQIPFAMTADGIHTTGLGGKFVMEDCYFADLGDDPLNIHAVCLLVTKVEGNRVTAIFDKPYCQHPKRWAQAGDVLFVRDGKTLADKGTLTVENYTDGLPYGDKEGIFTCAEVTFTTDSAVAAGDFISNSAMYVDAEIRRNTFKGSKRVLTLQGIHSAVVEDNTFTDTYKSVYISSAYTFWSECGPAKNVTVRNNRFIRPHMPSVIVQIKEPDLTNLVPIHENITIEDNVIIDSDLDKNFELSFAENLVVRNNIFVRCKVEE